MLNPLSHTACWQPYWPRDLRGARGWEPADPVLVRGRLRYGAVPLHTHRKHRGGHSHTRRCRPQVHTAVHTHSICRRRIYKYTEEKAKVVAAVFGREFIKFLAALAILHKDNLKNRMNSSFSSYHPGLIHSFLRIILVQNFSAARDCIHFVPQTAKVVAAVWGTVYFIFLRYITIVYINLHDYFLI